MDRKNKKAHLLYQLLLLVCLTSGCMNNDSTAEKGINNVDGTYKTIMVNPQPLTEPDENPYRIQNVEFIQLDDVLKDALIDGISDLIINDSLIYIVDLDEENTIHVFDRSGKFLNKIDKRGKAPDEYVSINQVRVNKTDGNIEILANTSKKLIKYNRFGDLLEYVNLPCTGLFNFFNLNGYYYYYKTLQLCDDELKQGIGHRLVRAKESSPGQIDHRYLPFQFKGRKTPQSLISFRNFAELPYSSDTLVLYDRITDTVMNITDQGVQPRYVIQFQDEGAKKSEILTDVSVLDKSVAMNKTNLTYLINWLETDKYILMQYSYFSTQDKQRYVSGAMYNKTMETVSRYQEYSQFKVQLDGISFDIGKFQLFLTNSGKFVCQINPTRLLQMLDSEQRKNGSSDSDVSEILRRYKLDGITAFDNPILMIFDFYTN